MAVRVRYRFLLGLLTVSLLTGGAVYGLHRYQLYRNANAFLTKARAERESGKISDAITYYQQFLGLNPNDAEARAELADIYRGIGNFEGEYLQLEQALRLDGTSIPLKKAAKEHFTMILQMTSTGTGKLLKRHDSGLHDS